MASNDNNGKRKVEEEAKSSVVRKRPWLSDEDGGDNDSSDSPEEEEEEEMEEQVSSEESSMNQLNTSKEKLLVMHGCDLFFSDDGDTTSPSLEPHTPEMPSNHMRSDPDGSEDDDFWM
jgi:hypothetical protein